MEHFSFYSGCVVRVAKHSKEDWLIELWYYIITAWNHFIPLLKCVIANVLKSKARLKTIYKCVCITMHFLVMSSFSRDLSNENTIEVFTVFDNHLYANSIYTVPGF